MTDFIEWREPFCLALGLLPLFFLIRKNTSHKDHPFQNYADKHLLPLLIHQNSASKRHLLIFSLAWISACIALAGPYIINDDEGATQRNAIDIALVIDISPSMSATDVAPSRLQRAQWELDRLIQHRPNDRFSLITFSSNAYITLPLTYDKNAIRHFLSALDTELPRRKGSNLGRGLELAQKTLANSKPNSRAIILLSDGEAHNKSNLGLARQLGEQKTPLLIWGVGTTRGAPVINSQGSFIYKDDKPLISKLRQLELNALAQASAGSYTRIQDDDSDLALLEARLNQIPALNRYQTDSRYTQPLFPWFLLVSLILLSLLTLQRAPIMALLILIPCLLPTKTSLAETNTSDPALALQQGNYALAEKLYSQSKASYDSNLGLGVIAYRQQHWQLAINFFRNALTAADNDPKRASATYNLGNSYAQANQLDLARQSFEQALRFQNNYPKARYNLNLVNNELTLRQQKNQNSTASDQEETTNTNAHTQTEQAQTSQTDTASMQEGAFNPSHATLNGQIEKLNKHAPIGVNLDNLTEDTRTLLEKRFSKQDHEDQLNRIEDKPW